MRAEVLRERDLQLAVRELEFLQRLSQSAASTRDSGELVELIIRESTAAIGTDVCSLYLVEAHGGDLALSATNGLNERMVGQVSMNVGEGITGWVAQNRKPRLVADVSLDPQWKWVPSLDEERFRSMLSVPVRTRRVRFRFPPAMSRLDCAALPADWPPPDWKHADAWKPFKLQ